MLQLQMVVDMRQELTLGIALTGGATDSILVAAERLLRRIEYQEALGEIVPKEVMTPYRSVMDMLVVETYVQLAEGCAAFYAGEGPPLREIATPSEVAMYDRGLVKVLRAAKRALRKKMEDRWHYALCAILM